MRAADVLAAAEYRAIPRGGLVVLGMLAYRLGLPRRQLERSSDGPLVLVDDCVLSGYRLRQALADLDSSRPVVVAHLLSTPEVRRAVLETEARVVACVAAADLTDQAPRLFPDAVERRAWRRRQEEHLAGDRRYWMGLPEPVSFAWSEPDHPVWNPATGEVDDGWRFVPPHRCLGNAARLAAALPAAPPAPPQADRQAEAGTWRCPEWVVWGDFEDRLWLVRDNDRSVFSLDGPAALAWKALALGREEAAAAAALAAGYRVTTEEAQADVADLRRELVAARLLEPVAGEAAAVR